MFFILSGGDQVIRLCSAKPGTDVRERVPQGLVHSGQRVRKQQLEPHEPVLKVVETELPCPLCPDVGRHPIPFLRASEYDSATPAIGIDVADFRRLNDRDISSLYLGKLMQQVLCILDTRRVCQEPCRTSRSDPRLWRGSPAPAMPPSSALRPRSVGRTVPPMTITASRLCHRR